jgi:hypothetical protein
MYFMSTITQNYIEIFLALKYGSGELSCQVNCNTAHVLFIRSCKIHSVKLRMRLVCTVRYLCSRYSDSMFQLYSFFSVHQILIVNSL